MINPIINAIVATVARTSDTLPVVVHNGCGNNKTTILRAIVFSVINRVFMIENRVDCVCTKIRWI